MAGNERFDDSIGRWLEDTAPARMPERVLAATFERTRRSRQQPGWRGILERLQMHRSPVLGGAAVVVAAVLALNLFPLLGPAGMPAPSPSPTASPSVEPAATPTTSTVQSTCSPLIRSTVGTRLGCSSDGTRVLFQRGNENLYIVHADGSETQVTDQPSEFGDIPGSSRPTGATISPDGTRVVFAGLTRPWEEGRSCHDGALFAVDADGGPAEVLWESQAADGGES